jgi:hypothetical protein
LSAPSDGNGANRFGAGGTQDQSALVQSRACRQDIVQ